MSNNKIFFNLPIYTEIIGKLSSVKYSDNSITIVLSINKSYELQIPKNHLINNYNIKNASGIISIIRTKSGYYIRDNT